MRMTQLRKTMTNMVKILNSNGYCNLLLELNFKLIRMTLEF